MTDTHQERDPGLFIEACRGEKTERVPVWLMRQAGRFQASYQQLRAKHGFLDLCRTPELSAQLTLNAVREFGFDAGIIFSDILIPLEPMGIGVEFIEGKGPHLLQTIGSYEDVANLRQPFFPADTPFLAEALRLTRRELPPEVDLIGFAGAPWTLACYLVEGTGSKSFTLMKRMMHHEPKLLHRLLTMLADMVGEYLAFQLDAGADAVQVFDSWAEILSPRDYAEFSLPYLRRVFTKLERRRQPKILFTRDAGAFMAMTAGLPIDVLGVDWRVDLAAMRSALPQVKAWQGNLDPGALLGDAELMLAKTRTILDENAHRPGYIFNLGHGVLPPTAEDNVRRLVEFVHEYRSR